MDKKTNNNGNKMKGFGFYAIIIILLVITVSVLMQQSGTTSVTYAQVVDAFEQEKVTEFVIDGNSLRATLKDQSRLEYDLPSVDLFFSDLGETIREQKQAGHQQGVFPKQGCPQPKDGRYGRKQQKNLCPFAA